MLIGNKKPIIQCLGPGEDEKTAKHQPAEDEVVVAIAQATNIGAWPDRRVSFANDELQQLAAGKTVRGFTATGFPNAGQ